MPIEEELIPATTAVADAPARSLLRAVCSFPVMLAMLLIVLATLTVRARFSDPDMWLHLKLGEIIWTTHSIPQVDLLSFTTNHHERVDHEWLAQITMYAAYRFAGYSGIMLWLCVFASLIPIGGYALCWIYSGNGKIAFLGAFGIWFFSTIGLAARPQVLGYTFLICELIIVSLGRQRNVKWFFALPLMFAVWVNCHGTFLLGLIVLGAILFCSYFDFRAGLLVSYRWGKQQRNALAAAWALSIAGVFLNPIGLKLVLYPLNVLMKQRASVSSISEWQPLGMSDIRVWAMFAAVALILMIPLLRREEVRLEELVLAGIGFTLAIQHGRMFFVFGILAMPVLSRLLSTAWEGYQPERDVVLPNLIVIVLAAISVVLGFPSSQYLSEQVRKANPVEALKFMQRSGLSGRMLNEYGYGGYLIWAAPDRKVFIDGRADVFEWTGVFSEYMKWAEIKVDPSLLLNKYQIDFCLLSREEPVVRLLQLLPGWKTVYSDDLSVIFARSAGGNLSSKAINPTPAQ